MLLVFGPTHRRLPDPNRMVSGERAEDAAFDETDLAGATDADSFLAEAQEYLQMGCKLLGKLYGAPTDNTSTSDRTTACYHSLIKTYEGRQAYGVQTRLEILHIESYMDGFEDLMLQLLCFDDDMPGSTSCEGEPVELVSKFMDKLTECISRFVYARTANDQRRIARELERTSMNSTRCGRSAHF